MAKIIELLAPYHLSLGETHPFQQGQLTAKQRQLDEALN